MEIFYEESEQTQKVMKRKNSEIYSICKSHIDNRRSMSNKTEESANKTNEVERECEGIQEQENDLKFNLMRIF